MRIATWNVNSLKARLEKLAWWLERARPDVVLLQETKSTDAEAPTLALRQHGYREAVDHATRALAVLATLPESAERSHHELTVQTMLGAAAIAGGVTTAVLLVLALRSPEKAKASAFVSPAGVGVRGTF